MHPKITQGTTKTVSIVKNFISDQNTSTLPKTQQMTYQVKSRFNPGPYPISNMVFKWQRCPPYFQQQSTKRDIMAFLAGEDPQVPDQD